MPTSSRTRTELRTIVTADLIGFSAQLKRDEEAVIRLLVDAYYTFARRRVEGHGGRLFRKEGDAIWAIFPSASAGVKAAAELQEDLMVRNLGQLGRHRMGLRVGVHLGDVTLTADGEVLGNTLSVAKRLETACVDGGVLVSGAVHQQVAGRQVGLEFEDRGVLELKGVGPTRAHQGMPDPARLVELMAGRDEDLVGRGGIGVVVLADLAGLRDRPTRRVEWLRTALWMAAGVESEVWVTPDDVAVMVLNPSAKVSPLPASEGLRGPRMVLTLGEVARSRDPSGRLFALTGEALEDAADGLRRTGLERDVILVTSSTGQLFGTRPGVDLVPAGRVANRRRERLWRYLPAGRLAGPLTEEHRPRAIGAAVTTPGGREIYDLVFGVRRGEAGDDLPAALGHVWSEVLGLRPDLKRASPVATGRAERVLRDDALAQLAAAAGCLASAEGLRLPARLFAAGEIEPGGAIPALTASQKAALGPLLAAGDDRVIVGARGLEALAPPGARVQVLSHLEETLPWLRGLGQRTYIETLAEAHARGELLVLVAGPAGGPPDQEELLRRCGVDAAGTTRARALEDAERAGGRERLRRDYARWAAGLGVAPLADRLRDLRPAGVAGDFPDPRLLRLGTGSAQVMTVTALGGSPEDPDGLVLTEADADARLGRLDEFAGDFLARLETHTLLVLGGERREKDLWHLVRALRARAPGASTRPWYLAPWGFAAGDGEWWRRREVEAIEGGPTALLEELTRRAGAAAPETAPARPAAGLAGLTGWEAPFVGSRPFAAHDAPLLFGRDREVVTLRDQLLSAEVSWLVGPAGAGRTSLFEAGVCPRLPPGWRVARWSPGDAGDFPGAALAVFDAAERLLLEPETRLPAAAAALAAARAAGARVLLVATPEARGPLAAALGVAADTPETRCDPLTREAAAVAIREPLRLFRVTIAPEAVEAVLDGLGAAVEPRHLQRVMRRLYLVRDQSRRHVDAAASDTLGGANQILTEAFRRWMDDRPAAERERLQRVFEAVEAAGTVPLGDLAGRVSIDVAALRPHLEDLAGEGWVRLVYAGAPAVRLAGPYLEREVRAWESQADPPLRHARMALAASMNNWEAFGVVLGPELLEIVARERRRLDIGDAERALLLRAAAMHDRPLPVWFGPEPGDPAAVEALLGLVHDAALPGAGRRQAIDALYGLPLPDAAFDRLLAGVEACGNPGLLAALRAKPGPAAGRYEAVRDRVHRRIFGPAKMARLAAGAAWVGSTDAEKRARLKGMRADLHPRVLSESPRTRVEVPAFAIDRFPITNADYEEFCPDHRHRFRPEDARHPVVHLDWYQAREYARWLGKDLPSEVEWERAARGLDGRAYPWGGEFDPARCNSAEGGLRATTPVDAYPDGATPEGVYDLVGNVWEWTRTPWEPGGPFKVQKGGCSVVENGFADPAARFEGFPDFVLQWVGARAMVDEIPDPDS